MSLTKGFFNRETNISAKVVADSINEQGIRITTFEVEYPRIVMSEFNTHRSISKNSSSSRAIPVSKMLEHTRNVNLKPIYFGSKKSGMQAGDELVGEELLYAKAVWESALTSAISQADLLDDLGVAKEVTNRLVEPFQLVKVVCTSTDWGNFFNLRLHPDADPNICMLAYKMYMALDVSLPSSLHEGDWHLPFVHKDSKFGYIADQTILKLDEAIKYSVASCASVSYRTDNMTLEKADKIFDMLIKADVVHSSPFEHIATPVVFKETNEMCNVFEYLDKVDGVTHINKQGDICSGNFRGWIQYRHTLKNNTCWNFNFEDRMKMFD